MQEILMKCIARTITNAVRQKKARRSAMVLENSS